MFYSSNPTAIYQRVKVFIHSIRAYDPFCPVIVTFNVVKHFYRRWCCSVCHSTCQTCSGPLDTDCTSCPEGLRTDMHGRCATPTSCPSHHYSDRDGACHLCHKHCHQCFGPDHSQCLSCYPNHHLLSESVNESQKYTTALDEMVNIMFD